MKPYESTKILRPEFKLDRTNPTISRLCELRDCTHPVKDFRIQNTYNQILTKDVTFMEIDGFVDSWTRTQDRFPKTADIFKWVTEKRKANPDQQNQSTLCQYDICEGNGLLEVKSTQDGDDNDYIFSESCACQVGMSVYSSEIQPRLTVWQREKIDSKKEMSTKKGKSEGEFFTHLVSQCNVKPTQELWNKIKSGEIDVPEEFSKMKKSLVGRNKGYRTIRAFMMSFWGKEILALEKMKKPVPISIMPTGEILAGVQ